MNTVLDTSLRRTSEVPDFPFKSRVCCWVEITDTIVSSPTTPADRRAALDRALRHESEVLIAWPGQWRTDLFRVDNPDTALEAT